MHGFANLKPSLKTDSVNPNGSQAQTISQFKPCTNSAVIYLNVDEYSPFHVAPSTPCRLDASQIKVSLSANQRLFPAGRMKESTNIGLTLLRG